MVDPNGRHFRVRMVLEMQQDFPQQGIFDFQAASPGIRIKNAIKAKLANKVKGVQVFDYLLVDRCIRL